MYDPVKLFVEHGYKIRKHIQEIGWDKRKLTVIDLNAEETEFLNNNGPEEFEKRLNGEECFIFPALEITKPLNLTMQTYLADASGNKAIIVIPKDCPHLEQAAKQLSGKISEQYKIKLEMLYDKDITYDQLSSANSIVFGGAHENLIAKQLSYRAYGFIDATIPGPCGIAVTTHVDVTPFNRNFIQLAGDEQTIQQAVNCLIEKIVRGKDKTYIDFIHWIKPGPEMKEHLPILTEYLYSFFEKRYSGPLEIIEPPLSSDPEQAAEQLARTLDCGGVEKNYYNVLPVIAGSISAEHAVISGDNWGLLFFKHMIFRFMDYYLNMPEGASIPGDFDFHLGNFVKYYRLAETFSIFTDQERVMCANFLLACTRTVFNYNQNHWKVEPDQKVRHNHQTFPAKTFLVCANYFDRYGIRDVEVWRKEAELIFSGEIFNRSKHRENANLYEYFVPSHAAEYSLYSGNLSNFDTGAFVRSARRAVIASDNFFRPTDYGDASVSMDPVINDILVNLIACHSEDPELEWFSRRCFEASPDYITRSTCTLSGLRMNRQGKKPECGRWERAELDKYFHRDYASEVSIEYTFDKMALRSGWEEKDQYILLEGVGNSTISHSHNETNSIVRYNHKGRHWLVSNGYGKPIGELNVSKSFEGRQRGPADHNMLVFEQTDDDAAVIPPFCSILLYSGASGNLNYLTSVLPNYNGVNWYRTIIAMLDEFLFVIDRIDLCGMNMAKGHIEWNSLGDLTTTDYGWRLNQKGVYMHVSNVSEWESFTGETPSWDWKKVMDNGDYPFASFPVKKIGFRLPRDGNNDVVMLCSLFSVTESEKPKHILQEISSGQYQIAGVTASDTPISIEESDLKIEMKDDVCDVIISKTADLPEKLKELFVK